MLKNKKGFTVIELITSFVFASILSITLFAVVIDYRAKEIDTSIQADLLAFKSKLIIDVDPIDITLSKRNLEGLKEKRGKDAVERYKSDGTTWICNCGYINAAGDEECAICGRKESDLAVNIGFNYEEMTDRMKGQPNVDAMKDILMEYIKKGAIDAKYRMELLEIMESGRQYEKTRGDMTATVLDKVLKVFEN